MSTSQRVETDVFCASERLYGDSVKRNKNKSKKLKSKKKGRHTNRKAEALRSDGFEATVTKKLRKNKDKRHKQKKNKDKSQLQQVYPPPLSVKQKQRKRSKSLHGSNQSQVNLLDQHGQTVASQMIRFTDSGSDAYGLFRSQVSKGSHLLKQEPGQAQCHNQAKSKNGAPRRKSVVFDHPPCSLEYVSSQVKKQKEGTKQVEAVEPRPPGPCGETLLLNSIFEPRRSCLTSEYEDKVLDPLGENDCKTSQATDENYNSEELFITQKTFLPAESSSDESVSTIASFAEPGDGQRGGVRSPPSPELFISRSTAEKATQTHDFFSSPVLSTSFGFHKLRQKGRCREQPLDLTVPKRLHREPGSGSADGRIKQENEETSCDPLYPEHRSAISNEQCGMPGQRKAGDAQRKVVQTRLNESFFFRMKGDGESPKPQSPLLNLGLSKSEMPQTYTKARRPSSLNS